MTDKRAELVWQLKQYFIAHHFKTLTTDQAASAALDIALAEAAKVARDYQHPNMALYPIQVGVQTAILSLMSKP